MEVLEVNDNDIYGKIFNGYLIMEELNKIKDFNVNHLVINKLSDNPKCVELFPNKKHIELSNKMYCLEKEVLSTHSLL